MAGNKKAPKGKAAQRGMASGSTGKAPKKGKKSPY